MLATTSVWIGCMAKINVAINAAKWLDLKINSLRNLKSIKQQKIYKRKLLKWYMPGLSPKNWYSIAYTIRDNGLHRPPERSLPLPI